MPRGSATWLPEDRLPQRYRGFPPILLGPPARSQRLYHIGHGLAPVAPSTSIRGLQIPAEAARERAVPRVDRRVLVNNRSERFIASPWCGEHQHHEAVHAVLGAPEITESVGLRVEQFHYGVVLVRRVVELEQAALALAPRRWRLHPRVGEGYPCPPDRGGRVERLALEQYHSANECVVRVVTTGRMEARSYTLYAHHLDVTCTQRSLLAVVPGACINVRLTGRFRCAGAPPAYRGG